VIPSGMRVFVTVRLVAIRECNPGIPDTFSIPKLGIPNPGISALKTGLKLPNWLQKSSCIIKIIVILHNSICNRMHTWPTCIFFTLFHCRSSKKLMYNRPIGMILNAYCSLYSGKSHILSEIPWDYKILNPTSLDWENWSGIAIPSCNNLQTDILQ